MSSREGTELGCRRAGRVVRLLDLCLHEQRPPAPQREEQTGAVAEDFGVAGLPGQLVALFVPAAAVEFGLHVA